MTVPKRILIVGDHAIVRAGIQYLVQATPEYEIAGEVADVGEAVDSVRRDTFALVILDIGLSSRSGLDAMRQIKRVCPALPILVYTFYPEHHYAIRAFRAGASGYLTKDKPMEELAKAMSTVSSGGRYVAADFAENLVNELAAVSTGAPHDALTNREYQILTMIAGGKALKEVATELSLSVKTVSAHKARILEKMNMRSNGELTYYSIKHGLL